MSDSRKTILDKARKTNNSAAGNTFVKRKSTPRKSLNSIPKNLRLDLENALIGLCDVWFEEIKPYLVRNNIKLHVYENGGDGDRENSRECSHNDPGRSDHRRRIRASCVDCSSAPRTASKALSLKQLAPRFAHTTPELIQGSRCNSKRETVRKPHKRKCAQTSGNVPRPCRAHSTQLIVKPYPVDFPKTRLQKTNKFLPLKEKPITVDASTQTEDLKTNKKKKNKPAVDNNIKSTRCSFTASYIVPKHNINGAGNGLFKDDLMNILAEKYEKKLKVLYTSPRTDDYPSVLNLYSPADGQRKYRMTKKIPPWK